MNESTLGRLNWMFGGPAPSPAAAPYPFVGAPQYPAGPGTTPLAHNVRVQQRTAPPNVRPSNIQTRMPAPRLFPGTSPLPGVSPVAPAAAPTGLMGRVSAVAGRMGRFVPGPVGWGLTAAGLATPLLNDAPTDTAGNMLGLEEYGDFGMGGQATPAAAPAATPATRRPSNSMASEALGPGQAYSSPVTPMTAQDVGTAASALGISAPAAAPAAQNMDAMPFGQAFAAARASGAPTFMWRGRPFTTQMAGEARAPVAPVAPAAPVAPMDPAMLALMGSTIEPGGGDAMPMYNGQPLLYSTQPFDDYGYPL